MAKNKIPRYVDWEKPRSNRSDLKVTSDPKINNNVHGPLAEPKTTKWKQMSEDTFTHLLDKDALSKEQIIEYMENKNNKIKQKRIISATNKIKNSEDFALIVELSKISMTSEGITKIRDLIEGKKNKSMLLKEAEKLRG